MKNLKLFVIPITLVLCMFACTPKEKNDQKAPLAKVTVSGNAGNFIRIKGRGFSTNKLENTVAFGDVRAVVLDATPQYLLVQVPPHKTGVVPVTVAVGAESSNPMMFEYNNSNVLLAVAIPARR
ncbi:IPT/TIG domain-containing protein [Chitinophaga dinghuensis]|uniref:IPT/TIG domain-containing protein n=1 Tax=Chitinophaga dinghuensis TaxID=1539050 RepID=A0A327W7H8_9BACT|nr:IPT/TIG domain-containing protein [Chitinophaga dinghuensis]RAJ85584.1 IPT/TIG domain-containing protein [Chitinophaga dinghuensis]